MDSHCAQPRSSQKQATTSGIATIRGLEQLAHIDPLTGLSNRRKLSEHLKQESERAKRHGSCFSLAMLDVDHFKLFNDHYGHPAGDSCLKKLTKKKKK